jgi:hypothetical protein
VAGILIYASSLPYWSQLPLLVHDAIALLPPGTDRSARRGICAESTDHEQQARAVGLFLNDTLLEF